MDYRPWKLRALRRALWLTITLVRGTLVTMRSKAPGFCRDDRYPAVRPSDDLSLRRLSAPMSLPRFLPPIPPDQPALFQHQTEE